MRDLEKKLNYTFRNQALLEEALNHSSYANEHRAGGLRSNERLEFLGDSVLGFVTAEFLFCQHPDLPEGDLTRIRAALVCEQSLYEVAQKLGLGQYLKLGRGEEAQGGRERPALLADAMEAVLGAVYLDGGHDEAARLVTRLYEGQWPDPASARKGKDYKTRLQEVTQARFRALPVYAPLASSGPEHAKVFEVRLELPDGRSFPASGGSLKRAEQEAARKALEYYGAQAGH